MNKKIFRKNESKNARTAPQNGQNLWLYGYHPVVAALKAKKRRFLRLLATKDTLTEMEKENIVCPISVEIVARSQLDALLPKGAVHQGIAAFVSALPSISLSELDLSSEGVVIVLDQVTDPHNVGAILRSAAAFDALAVITAEKNAPEATASLAKSASGALEFVPLIYVSNLIRSLEYLKENGFWCVGLDGHAENIIGKTQLPEKCVLILGSEGYGMRRLTSEACDLTVKLPISEKMESLNVSNASAIALYEYATKKKEIKK